MVYTVWAALVGVALTLGVLALEFLAGYGAPPTDAWASLGRLWTLTLLSAGIAVPVAWIASLTRSFLAAVGSTIALVVISQIGALAGAEGWMPLAAPALWAMSGGSAVTPAQLVLPVILALVSAGLTCLSWSRLQLDR